ncbi:MAG: phosphatidylglycerophosphate synthase [Psychroserpens sp.]|jgi:phosphatidylglycerophosphate synthase
MKTLINRLFSAEYAKNRATEQNLILLGMYRFAYPFSLVLNRLHVTANQITIASIIFAMLAAFFLINSNENGNVYFFVFWFLSLLLDFCDGTVARMSNNTSKTALKFDHLSDLFKIFIVMLGASIHYDQLIVWCVSMSASFLFMYYMVVNHQLSGVRALISKNCMREENVSVVEKVKFYHVKKVIKSDVLIKKLKSIYIPCVTINGHTLLIFLFLPWGEKIAISVCLYFSLLSLRGIFHSVLSLLKIPRRNVI